MLWSLGAKEAVALLQGTGGCVTLERTGHQSDLSNCACIWASQSPSSTADLSGDRGSSSCSRKGGLARGPLRSHPSLNAIPSVGLAIHKGLTLSSYCHCGSPARHAQGDACKCQLLSGPRICRMALYSPSLAPRALRKEPGWGRNPSQDFQSEEENKPTASFSKQQLTCIT